MIQALAFLLLVIPSVALSATASFSWMQNAEADLAGYRIKYGPTKGGPYTTTVDCGTPAAVGGRVQYTLASAPDGLTYYVLVAVDAAGQESAPSNEVLVDPAPASPGGFSYTLTGSVAMDQDGTVHLDLIAKRQ